MAIVTFLKHCPPHMPGDVAGMDDTHATALAAKGIVALPPSSVSPATGRRRAAPQPGAAQAPEGAILDPDQAPAGAPADPDAANG